MIRIIFDFYSDSHKDLFLKIDVFPSNIIIADTYFLPEFLEIDEIHFQDLVKGRKYTFLKYIEYLIEQINLDLEITYLVIDLSDQYIGCIELEKFEFEQQQYYVVNYAFTTDFVGWAIGHKISQEELKGANWRFDKDYKCETTKDLILEGFELSKEMLK